MSVRTAVPPAQKPQVKRNGLHIPFIFTVVFMVLGILSGARTNKSLALTFGGVAAVLLAWQAWLYILSKRKDMTFAWDFVAQPSHYVQAIVQISIYLYWGWYWRNVYTEAPLILSQIAFLYAFDALVTWSRGQTWRMGFGALPIIFSTNLFMWFRNDWFIFQFLMVATGVLGKQFVRWQRDGKMTHIFNPSAFGLTIFSLGLLFTGTTDHTWGIQIALTQGHPPHPYTQIFLFSLLVQVFFYVTILTFSAVAAICLVNYIYLHTTGVYMFVDSNIPIAVFLGLHLLMTDPATTPRSSLGRAIFGGLYGLGVCVAFLILDAMNLPSFYDKLIIVPLLNLIAPLLDRCANFGWLGSLRRWEVSVGPRNVNLGVMGCWITLYIAMIQTGYIEARHPGATIGFWAKAAEEHRTHAMKYLRRFLRDFDAQDLEDNAVPVGIVGQGANRDQALGVLYNQVASIYAQGKLVPPDPAKACRLFAKSCELGNSEGCANLASAYLVSGRAEAASNAPAAIERLENAAPQINNSQVYFLVGYACASGKGHALDKAKGRQYYEKSARLGDINACKQLGIMEMSGEGGPVDCAAAAGWLQKSADAQDGTSCLYLARLYHTGTGVPPDEQRANALLQQACNLGVQPACELLKNAGH